jgi:hypothetical protein
VEWGVYHENAALQMLLEPRLEASVHTSLRVCTVAACFQNSSVPLCGPDFCQRMASMPVCVCSRWKAACNGAPAYLATPSGRR